MYVSTFFKSESSTETTPQPRFQEEHEFSRATGDQKRLESINGEERNAWRGSKGPECCACVSKDSTFERGKTWMEKEGLEFAIGGVELRNEKGCVREGERQKSMVSKLVGVVKTETARSACFCNGLYCDLRGPASNKLCDTKRRSGQLIVLVAKPNLISFAGAGIRGSAEI